MTESTHDDLRQQISQAEAAGDLDQVASLALQAFADEQLEEEELLAWVSKLVYDHDLTEAFSVIPKFVSHFPHSRQGVQVYLADKLAEQEDFDAAAEEARQYLARHAANGALADACSDEMVADCVLQALQLIGTSYCLAGARTYGQQIHAYAASLADDPGWKLSFEQSIIQTEQELTELDLREVDFYWRTFMQSGDRYEEICGACDELDMPRLKQRMSELRRRYQQDPDFVLPEHGYLLDLALADAQPASTNS